MLTKLVFNSSADNSIIRKALSANKEGKILSAGVYVKPNGIQAQFTYWLPRIPDGYPRRKADLLEVQIEEFEVPSQIRPGIYAQPNRGRRTAYAEVTEYISRPQGVEPYLTRRATITAPTLESANAMYAKLMAGQLTPKSEFLSDFEQ